MGRLTQGKDWGLRRLTDDAGRFKMLAVDQRPPIQDLVAAARAERDARPEDVCAVKRLLVQELAAGASAVLLDPHYAYPAAVDAVSPHSGLLLTLEDSDFVETDGGRLSRSIDDWSVDKIRRIGGDAVKVLAWYRPDAAPDVIEHQQTYVAAIGEQCRRYDIPFLLELLVYPFPSDPRHTSDYVEHPNKHAEHVIESVETFADPAYGVDVFKLESPIPAHLVPDPESGVVGEVLATQKIFDALGAASPVPWVMLSAGATKDAFMRTLHYAFRAGASGFLAGRAIWWDELSAFPDIAACGDALATSSVAYLDAIGALTDAEAVPFAERPSQQAPCPGEPPFRRAYGSIVQ
jgi:tagatose 1,6-diphosphate aldolase